MRTVVICLSLACFFLSQGGLASADWLWTPKLGKWLNPKKAAKETPTLQLEFATRFWNEQKYERAQAEFAKLVHVFPQAPEAPEAQYYVGRCAEEAGDYYAAFQAYRKVLQVYPASMKTEEILERQYRIGNLFFQGEKRELLGAKILSGIDTAIEIYRAIVEDAPFSAQGPLALYKLGMAHKIQGDLQAATDAFQRLVEEHPQHALVDDATFQIADCSAKTNRAVAYDQSYADEATREFQQFAQEHPDSHLVPEAEARVDALMDQRAQHDFEVAQFYERRHVFHSARVYYESIMQHYPRSQWAVKAAEQLQVLDGKVRK